MDTSNLICTISESTFITNAVKSVLRTMKLSWRVGVFCIDLSCTPNVHLVFLCIV